MSRGILYWTNEVDDRLLVIYTHRLGQEDTACHTGPHRGCMWEQNEAAGAAGDRLCSTRDWGARGSHQEDGIGLFEWFHRLAGEGNL